MAALKKTVVYSAVAIMKRSCCSDHLLVDALTSVYYRQFFSEVNSSSN